MTPEVKALALGLYLQRATYPEIRRQTGIGAATLHRLLVSHGVPRVRGRGRPLGEDAYRDIEARYLDKGESVSAIARALGCAEQSVYNVLRRAGVTFRQQRGRTMTAAEKARMVARYRDGTETPGELRAIYGVSETFLYKELQRHGVRSRARETRRLVGRARAARERRARAA